MLGGERTRTKKMVANEPKTLFINVCNTDERAVKERATC